MCNSYNYGSYKLLVTCIMYISTLCNILKDSQLVNRPPDSVIRQSKKAAPFGVAVMPAISPSDFHRCPLPLTVRHPAIFLVRIWTIANRESKGFEMPPVDNSRCVNKSPPSHRNPRIQIPRFLFASAPPRPHASLLRGRKKKAKLTQKFEPHLAAIALEFRQHSSSKSEISTLYAREENQIPHLPGPDMDSIWLA